MVKEPRLFLYVQVAEMRIMLYAVLEMCIHRL